MGKPAILVRRAAPPTSPLRADLDELIKARAEANARLAAVSSANSWEITFEAERARDAAAKAVEDASARDAAANTEALISGAEAPAPTLPAARAALQAAEDRVDAAKSTRAALATEIEELRQAEVVRQNRIDAAVHAVLEEEASQAMATMIAEFEATQRALIDKGLAIAALHRATYQPGPPSGATRVENSLYTAPRHWGLSLEAADNPSAAAWERAIADLHDNADTALPR